LVELAASGRIASWSNAGGIAGGDGRTEVSEIANIRHCDTPWDGCGESIGRTLPLHGQTILVRVCGFQARSTRFRACILPTPSSTEQSTRLEQLLQIELSTKHLPQRHLRTQAFPKIAGRFEPQNATGKTNVPDAIAV
jgi:hypothetical protein